MSSNQSKRNQDWDDIVLTWMQVVPMGRKKCIYDEVVVNVTLFVNVDDGKSDLIIFLCPFHWHSLIFMGTNKTPSMTSPVMSWSKCPISDVWVVVVDRILMLWELLKILHQYIIATFILRDCYNYHKQRNPWPRWLACSAVHCLHF